MESPYDEANGCYETAELTFPGGRIATDMNIYEDAAYTVPVDFAPNSTAFRVVSVSDDLLSTEGLQVKGIDTHITNYNGAEFDLHGYDIFYIEGDELYWGDS